MFRLTESAMMAGMGDEMVLLDSLNGHYYSLDRIGRKMLDLALEENDQGQVVAQLEAQFDADAARLEADFRSLMASLEEAGLIQACA